MTLVLKSLLPAYGGYTIARDKDEKVILLRGAVPGEVIEVKIEERKRDYSIAKVTDVIEPSEDRVEPECRVFGLCGGCQLQFMSYSRQLIIKDEILHDSLTRIGGIEISLSPSISDKQWNYRHKANFKVSKLAEVGLFKGSSREIIDFETCPLMKPEINMLLQKIKQGDMAHNLNEIHIGAGNSSIALLRGKNFNIKLIEQYMKIGFSGIGYNETLCSEAAYTSFVLNGLTYTVSPWTFFQSHWSLNNKIVKFIMDKLMPLNGKRVLDLYAGAGNFSLPAAIDAEEVIAVEENLYAVNDGIRNLALNKIKNCKFVRASAEKYKISKKYDIIILDPPRAGLSVEVRNKILGNPSNSIVYISCNPATLARDLKYLKEKYEIESVRHVDFFPNTFHIESVAFLQIR